MIIDLILISTHAPAGGATQDSYVRCMGKKHFYSRPCGRGDVMVAQPVKPSTSISTHAPAGGATRLLPRSDEHRGNFYSRPCGRGDPGAFSESGESTISTHAPAGGATYTMIEYKYTIKISTHAPAGGATLRGLIILGAIYDFYSRPCGRGDRSRPPAGQGGSYFYSRPCGRGDARLRMLLCFLPQFLLTPLREGRRGHGGHDINGAAYFYSRPCGRGDVDRLAEVVHEPNFYSRPCGRGDEAARRRINERIEFLLTPLREGRPDAALQTDREDWISTHAPAGGATRGTVYRANPHGVISTHAPAGGATQPHIYTVW